MCMASVFMPNGFGITFMDKGGSCFLARYSLFAILLASASSVFANEPSSEPNLPVDRLFHLSLEELSNIKVSVSSLKEQRVYSSPSTVTVVGRDSIEKYHYSSVSEALDTVAGFEVYRTIIDREVPTSRGVLQNFYANKILLLIDNIPTWQPIYGNGAIERININDVERIEVLKGPASVLYGSNAYNGVVNVVLRNKKDDSLSSYGRLGGFDFIAGGVSLNKQFNEWSIFASLHSEKEGGDTYQVVSAEGKEFNGESIYGYESYRRNNSFNFGVEYQEHNFYVNHFDYNYSNLGVHPSFVGGGGRNVEDSGTLVNYKYKASISQNTGIYYSLTYDYFERYFPVSYDTSSSHEIAASRYANEIKFNYRNESINIEYGFNAEVRKSEGHDNVNSVTGELLRNNLKDEEDAREWSSFARVKYDIDDFSFLVGGRYTDSKNFGSNVSTHLSGVYSIKESQSIKLIFGQSFRVPTLFEQYFERPLIKGNAELEPETSTSYELAYLYGDKSMYAQFLVYYAVYENLIQRQVPASGPPAQYQNVSGMEGYGAEVELRYEFDTRLSGYINYGYIAGVGEESDNNYRYVPDHTVSLGVDREFSLFSVSAKGKYISPVDGNLAKIPSQFTLSVNATARQSFRDYSLRHVLSFDNMNNSEMRTPEYIRNTANVNDIITEDYGRRLSYSVYVDF